MTPAPLSLQEDVRAGAPRPLAPRPVLALQAPERIVALDGRRGVAIALMLAVGSYEAVFTQDRVVNEAGSYAVIVGLSESHGGLQQFEGARIDFTSENALRYLPHTSGVGVVLDSMESRLRAL